MQSKIKTTYGIAILGTCFLIAISLINYALKNFNSWISIANIINPHTQLAQVADITNGLVGHWTFDEGSGTTASDTSGNGNNGTLVNFPSDNSEWVAGKVGQGLKFDGVDDYVTLGNPTSLQNLPNSTFSVSGWVNLPDGATSLIRKGTGSNVGWAITIDKYRRLSFNIQMTTTDLSVLTSSGTMPSSNQWVHFVVVYPGKPIASDVRVYANGIEVTDFVAQADGIGSYQSDSSTEGRLMRNAFSDYSSGAIDDVRIYNRALTQGEITQLYTLGEGKTPPIIVNGSCSSTLNQCAFGEFSDIADTSTNYLWNCLGSGGGTTAFCSLPVNQQSTTFTLTIQKIGQGIVTGGSIDCGSTCSQPNTPAGSQIILTGTNSVSGYIFSGWSGGECSGTGQCIVTMNSNIVVTANFVEQILSPTVSAPNNITEPGEVCDGTDLNGYTCSTVAAGFTGGALSCNTNRTSYNTSLCVSGNIIQAASCLARDVQVAIDSAVDGDTVIVPAGDCIWKDYKSQPGGSGAVVMINNKSVVLKGAGIGKTIIRQSVETGRGDQPRYDLLSVDNPEWKPFRITGFSIVRNNTVKNYGSSIIRIRGSSKNWRIDNNDFFLDAGDGNVQVSGYTYGLIDHNSFGGYARILIYADGESSWKRPLQLGTANAVYMENNVHNHVSGNSVDSNDGGRYVFRHNIVTNGYVMAHGAEWGRGTFSYEIYDNDITDGSTSWVPVSQRAGTGVIFNNIFRGFKFGTGKINLYIDRVTTLLLGSKCNGTSSIDGNIETNGYPCLDQPGRSTDNSLSIVHPQKLEPLYEWNNKNYNNGVWEDADIIPTADSATYIVENRDYYNDKVKPGYLPYPYPHPLALIEPMGGTPITPPSCTSFTYSPWSLCSNSLQTRTVVSSSPTSCTGGTPILTQSCTNTTSSDFNSDGLVNTIDLSLLLSYWNQANPTYDLNNDGVVNSLDYATLVGSWSQ